MADDARTAWTPAHFIGGHPALDLANAVFDRRAPVPDNELLKTARDVGNWLRASGLAGGNQANAVARIADAALVDGVREIREATFSIFDAIAASGSPAAESLGLLFRRAADGLSAGPFDLMDTRPKLTPARWREPKAVIGFLAMLSIEAFVLLPRDRLRSCPRCGWLFVDVSRGGKRRWCSMQTCGNREKVSRHRGHAHV